MSAINNTIGNEQVPTSGAFVGYNAIIYVADTAVSRVQRLSFTVNNNIQQVYVVSSRTPLNVETRLLIRGTIRRLFFNTAMLRLTMGVPASLVPTRPGVFDASFASLLGGIGETGIGSSTPLFASQGTYLKAPPISIRCELYIENNGQYYSLKLENVKFDSYDMTIDANAIVLENVAFVAEGITILAAPIDASGGSSGDSTSSII